MVTWSAVRRMRRLGEAKAGLLAVLAVIVTALSFQYISRALARSWTPRESGQLDSASSESVLQGSRLYLANCADCHGYEGAGSDFGPSLHKLQAGDPVLKLVIVDGVDREMPGFGKRLDDAQIRCLIAYLRSWKD